MVTVTVAVFERAMPSLTGKLKVSVPFALGFGV